MRRFAGNLLRLCGFSPKDAMVNLKAWPAYRRQKRIFFRQSSGGGQSGLFPPGPDFPILTEAGESGGTARGHYFHQDLLVARLIHEANPRRHVDVGSRVDGFVAHVAAFREIEVLDIRPNPEVPHAIRFHQLDLMAPLPKVWQGCCDSLSCLHALEHFGLGRYGDAIDAMGHEKALANLTDMLEPGGVLYLSVPIGPQRVEFNAHRVFAVGTVLEMLEGPFSIEGFHYVDDHGDLHRDVDWVSSEAETSFGCLWGCGIFVARKMAARAK
jgi:SAM-dependent methyltransferase